MNPLEHVIYKIRNTQISEYPFPHFYIQDIFPADFYSQILDSLPPDEKYASNGHNYNGRKFADPSEQFKFLYQPAFARSLLKIFHPHMMKRFDGQDQPKFTQDLRLILDGENYAIGPHTDAPWKVLSLLFYLPKDNGLRDLGTSIYLPKDRTFTCEGGPHLKFEDFEEIYRAPFLPNTLFAFFKTNYSFHGVEPIKISCRRDVLLWNLYANHPQH